MTGGKIKMCCTFSSRTYMPATIINLQHSTTYSISLTRGILATQCIYLFLMILTINSDYIHTWL